MGDLVIEIEDLVVRYGRGKAAVTAVAGLSLAVAQGSVTAVLGPNGAGKTTTMETCEGYRRPTRGRVSVLGLDPVSDRRALMPRVGVMLQEGGAWSGARAVEMLRHVARLHANPLDVDLLVQRLDLAGCGRTPYRRLSGGEKQRLALAMALVGRPELVILDEPTAGLDPHARRATWELVEELRRDGVSLVLTTHHMEEAERLADQVYVIDRGRVIAAGSPSELTSRGAANTLRFRGPMGLDLRSLLAALPDGSGVREPAPGSYLILGKIDPHLLATVTAWCAAHGVLADDLAVERHTLEDVFLELTGRELRP
ncbi:ATP-binding cassette domain-containing protein [Actinopolymorpha pittospori]|uniref:ABC-2 type transport system ATP-binding protein n=1 Tax=Actinopolymorpha pittospori TaxID=648752 RepID=A0A927RDI1_9ACTN|nr:ABC-2 type transport system ATP-binding protein [Actinopolymorpha pittospori]